MFVKMENIDLNNLWIVFQNLRQQRRYFKMEQVDLIIEVNDIHVLVIEGCHGCDHTEVAYHH
jgi:hypothetical protein